MKRTKMITEAEYLTQYLNDWKESTSDLFTEDDIMISFLKIKERQFNLKSYKKQIKLKKILNARLSDNTTASDEFFV